MLFVGLGYCRFVCVLLAGSGLRRVCGLVGMHWFGFAGCYGCGVNLVVWVLWFVFRFVVRLVLVCCLIALAFGFVWGGGVALQLGLVVC